jgi:hypothetical protein
MMTAKANQVGGFNPWATAVYARAEARRRGNRRVGTEDLVLGLLREPDGAQVLGCDLGAAREALDAMDRDALVAIGIDRSLDAPPVPTREPALGGRRAVVKAVLRDHLPMTPVAKRRPATTAPRSWVGGAVGSVAAVVQRAGADRFAVAGAPRPSRGAL